MQDTAAYVRAQAAAARNAYYAVSAADSSAKNAALLRTAELLDKHRTAILAANRQDMENAETKGLDAAMLDRLQLSDAGIDNICEGLRQIAALPDPVGEMDEFRTRPNGLQIGKMRVPLGVIGIIYESRPNVTADAAALCLKSGNACVLRGGSEAVNSNSAIAKLFRQALHENGLPADAVCFIEDTAREGVGAMLQSPDLIDVIIPRGGRSLIERISAEAKVPVIKHLDGVCHTYVDEPCDEDLALKVADNAKTQKYSPCNATETLLVARGVAARFLPRMAAIYAAKGVLMRCDAESLALLEKWRQSLPPGQTQPQLAAAQEEDWRAEYLAPIIAIKVVAGLDEAMAHINHYGSHHTDAILTSSHAHAQRFLREVDSASCMVNASTRFADGFEYGLGAEIGISTDKFHARGPVGIEGLTSLKWVVLGEGHIRQ